LNASGIPHDSSDIDEAPPALLTATNVHVHFPIRRGVFKRLVGHVRAVDGVSLGIRPGETLSLVGESGCGKTTLGRSLVGVVPPTGGAIVYTPPDRPPAILSAMSEGQLRPYRAEIRMIFQDPYASLNPRRRVLDIIGEPMRNFGVLDEAEVEQRVAGLLRRVGLRPEYMTRYPYAFSGGERQRIAIARALSVGPKLVVADECVSALDVSVKAQTLNLLQDLQEDLSLTYLFISHDLGVVEYVSDRVAVMYAGRIVELAETESLFARPHHPYTAALLAAVPRPDPRSARRAGRIRLKGEVADPANRPSGCAFHPRCHFATSRCQSDDPATRVIDGHEIACHYAETLELPGVTLNTTL
jgi:peptide/nickel transport system ATP-binding protein